jgi:hypothetical protein
LAKALYAARRVGTKVREILRRDLDPAPAQLVERLRLAGHGLKRHGIGDHESRFCRGDALVFELNAPT